MLSYRIDADAGLFVPYGSGTHSPEFSFFDTPMVYQAPRVDKTTDVRFVFTGNDFAGAQKDQTIRIIPAKLSVSLDSKSLYAQNKLVSP